MLTIRQNGADDVRFMLRRTQKKVCDCGEHSRNRRIWREYAVCEIQHAWTADDRSVYHWN